MQVCGSEESKESEENQDFIIMDRLKQLVYLHSMLAASISFPVH